MSEIDQRRQRAREAYWAACGIEGSAIDAAIETATRVKITDEAIALAIGGPRDKRYAGGIRETLRDNLATALTELGFKVEE